MSVISSDNELCGPLHSSLMFKRKGTGKRKGRLPGNKFHVGIGTLNSLVPDLVLSRSVTLQQNSIPIQISGKLLGCPFLHFEMSQCTKLLRSRLNYENVYGGIPRKSIKLHYKSLLKTRTFSSSSPASFSKVGALSLWGCPVFHGQRKAGPDRGPKLLKSAGIESVIADCGWELESNIDIELKSEEINGNLDFPASLSVVDPEFVGGCCSNIYEAMTSSNSIKNRSSKNDDGFQLIIGGDHSISMGTVPALAAMNNQRHLGTKENFQMHENLGVIWVDAHADLHTPEVICVLFMPLIHGIMYRVSMYCSSLKTYMSTHLYNSNTHSHFVFV